MKKIIFYAIGLLPLTISCMQKPLGITKPTEQLQVQMRKEQYHSKIIAACLCEVSLQLDIVKKEMIKESLENNNYYNHSILPIITTIQSNAILLQMHHQIRTQESFLADTRLNFLKRLEYMQNNITNTPSTNMYIPYAKIVDTHTPQDSQENNKKKNEKVIKNSKSKPNNSIETIENVSGQKRSERIMQKKTKPIDVVH